MTDPGNGRDVRRVSHTVVAEAIKAADSGRWPLRRLLGPSKSLGPISQWTYFTMVSDVIRPFFRTSLLKPIVAFALTFGCPATVTVGAVR